MVANAGISTPAPPLTWNLNGVHFDAWLRLNHNTSLTVTQHPVETGAAISDHSFVNPRRFSFDIGMTDVANTPVFQGNNTRSVNAYNALTAMQATRQLLTLASKYGNYRNILIESVNVSDDFRTKNAMFATITLVEIIMAKTQVTRLSAVPQLTDKTSRGTVSPHVLTQKIIEAGRKVGLDLSGLGAN
jgi:hypothetical protein